MRSRALRLMVVLVLSACTKLNSEANDGGPALSNDGGPGQVPEMQGGSGGTPPRAGTGGMAGVTAGKGGGTGGTAGTAGSEAAGASGSDSGTDTMSGQDAGVPEPTCDTDGALRCAGSGSVAREKCEAGQWVATDSCADTEVCNGSDDVPAGTCSSLFELCVGHANEAVCVGADMHFCNADSLSTHSEACGSERLCQAGVAAGACPLCLADSFQCSGRQLQQCSTTGSAWMDMMLCDTPELCNETSGACTASACLPGDKTCSGDKLQKCRTDQSGYEDDTTCGAGLCDLVGGECDICVPQGKVCNATNDGYRVCTGSGQGYTDYSCDLDMPHCTGNGTCVECTTPTQCDVTNECKNPLCNAGMCGESNKSSGSCTRTGGGAGVCSGGSCVQCTGAGNCGGSTPFCVSNVCRPCVGGNCSVGTTCVQASDCASNICTGGKCRPTCTGSCAVGDACALAGDCASNECTSSLCTKSCGAVTLTSQGDYDSNKDCTKITGDLVISYNSAVKNPEFANLTNITGTVAPTYSSGTNTMTGLRLPAIKTIGGGVTLTATNIATINWPELTSIGGMLSVIQMLQLTSFETPKLTSIGGPVQFTLDGLLTRLDMRALRTVNGFYNILSSDHIDTAFFANVQTVSGSVNIGPLMHLSYSAVKPLWDAGDGSQAPNAIGCCLAGPTVTTSNCGSINIFSPECTQ